MASQIHLRQRNEGESKVSNKFETPDIKIIENIFISKEHYIYLHFINTKYKYDNIYFQSS